MIKITKILVILGCCIAFVGHANAGSKEDQLIDKVVAAYGGKQLLKVKSLNIKDYYKGFSYGQSHNPTMVDLVSYRSDSMIDLNKKRKDFKWIRGGKSSFSTQHQIFDGNQGYQLNHTLKTLSPNASLTYASADRRHFYYLDTALAILLNENRADAKLLLNEKSIAGSEIQLRLTIKGYEELTLYIDEKTGLIAKMSKPHWAPGKLSVYNYSDVKQQQGVRYAGSTYVTKAGQPSFVSISRTLVINPDTSNYFKLPNDYKENAPTLSFSEMMVEKIFDNIYIAGKSWGFSVFLDTGDYFIGTGGYEDLKQRFWAVQKFANMDKPLKYQVVSHHHTDHLEGMKEANELGVTFISVEEHQALIKELAQVDIKQDRFEFVKNKASFANGALQVFDIASGHATHNLITYFSQAKLLFTADMFFSRKVKGSPNGGATLQLLNKRLLKEQLDVDYFAAAHSGRVLTAEDFDYALNHIVKAQCPENWQICEGY
ncbi:MBL fold metallo-hydrolase [Cognaticolwellia mytili]|uniref:hypothetical protein n=1 Tax=Cognaticolwellia mytili TaxID=1888913 RepID=UPI000A1740EA|nr:hypothetical protein [Cognaticolwellia mytili]